MTKSGFKFKRTWLICLLLVIVMLFGSCRQGFEQDFQQESQQNDVQYESQSASAQEDLGQESQQDAPRPIPQTQKHQYIEPLPMDYNLENLPEFVDDVSSCVDPQKQYVLPDGYIYESQAVPIYSAVNHLNISTDENGDIFNGCGYQDNARIRGILEIGDSDCSFVTGFIPATQGDTIYFNEYCFDPNHGSAHILNIVFYDADKNIVTATAMKTALDTAFDVVETRLDDEIASIKIKDDLTSIEISYVRLTLLGSGVGNFVGVNEPLVPSDYQYEWRQTEKYLSADWYAEIKNTIETVNNLSREDEGNVVRFLFASDIHLDPYSTTSFTENIGKVSAEVMRSCDIPFFVTGGDNCTQSSGFMPSDFATNMKDVLTQLLPISEKNILLSVGNHDGATGMAYDQYGEKVYYRFQLSNEERSAVFFDWQRETNENKKFDLDGTYYYLDDPTTQTRYIVLNSFWSQWQGNAEGYVYDIQHSFFHSHRFGSQQLHWFAEEALDMPSGYGAVIVAHFAQSAKDFDIFKGIVEAFDSQTIYRGTYQGEQDWQAVDMAVNYEDAYGEIIALFQGHNHMDATYDDIQNVPCINITTAGAHWAVKDENAVERIKGTASEFAVDVVTIDREARKIYLTRLGAGEDRVIDY